MRPLAWSLAWSLALAALAALACVEKPVASSDAATSTSAPAPAAKPSRPAESAASEPEAPLPPERPEAPPPAVGEPPPGTRQNITTWVGQAYRAAGGDLDGDGKTELVFGDAQRLWVIDRTGKTLAELPAVAGIQVLRTVDV